MKGYGQTSRQRIENGRCVDCGKTKVEGRVKCDDCVMQERIWFRQRKLEEVATSPAHHERLKAIWQYLGVGASPDHVQAAYELEQSNPVRWIFFRWLFDGRKRLVGLYADDAKKAVFGSELNELIADALQYAGTVPDPLREIEEWSKKREIETRGRTPLAVAMSHYDGMTPEDFEVVRPLYA